MFCSLYFLPAKQLQEKWCVLVVSYLILGLFGFSGREELVEMVGLRCLMFHLLKVGKQKGSGEATK